MRTALVKMLKTAGFSAIIFSLIVLSLCPLQVARSTNSSLLTFFVITTSQGRIIQSFGTIQEAINTAENGSTIQVPSGTYYEQIVINKTISLIGENSSTTIIDGSNNGTVVQITANNVNISGFTARNSGWGWYKSGIETQNASDCRIENNILFHTCHNIRLNFSRNCIVANNVIDHINQMGYGIRITESVNCTIQYNFVAKNIGGIVFENSSDCTAVNNNVTRNNDGIRLQSSSSNNKISGNNVFNNSYCGMIFPVPDKAPPKDNALFHNNFVNNTNPFIIQSGYNIWDYGYPFGGNYWSQYNGTDSYSGPYQNETESDGIGDTAYNVGGTEFDGYPLMYPWSVLPVHNIDKGTAYSTIQAAIGAPETLDTHVLWVDAGIYEEDVTVNKSLTLIGEDANTTIIDGEDTGTVVTVEADNVTFTGFTVRNSGLNYPPYGNDCGVLLDHCASSNISGNQITENRVGIYLYYSTDNTVENNVVYANHEDGIWLWSSGGNTLSGNNIYGNAHNFGVFGSSFPDFNNAVDTANTVDGKPIQYVVNAQDEIIDNQTDVGTLYLINCINVTVRDLSLTRNGHGVFCYNTTGSRVENVTTFENSYGIYLQDSRDNNVNNNHCTNDWVGICLQNSDQNTAENNTVSSGEKAFSLYEADNNTIAGNTISDSLYGIRLYDSNNNIIHHNNLINNTEQVSLITCYQNSWDDGFEGNFWSSYSGSDANRDGIGDDSHLIDGNNVDQHPLFGMFHNFSALDNEKTCYVMIITNSTILNFTFEDSSNMVKLTVDGSDETYGFCRIAIPHTLLEPEITVLIDAGSTEPLYANYSLRDDGNYRWIYFAYQHTTHEITIISESWLPLTFCALMFVTFLCLVNKKHLPKDTCLKIECAR